MARMTVCGTIDPLLSIELEQGESVLAERNAMVAMDAALSLTGGTRGGIMSALARKVLNDETFFQQQIEAREGPGRVLLAPTLPGDIALLEAGERQYLISDGSWLASDSGVELEIKTQSLGRALLADSGGFFLMRTQGRGRVAVSGLGSLKEIELDGRREIYVDNGHLVAWDSALEYALAVNTAKRGFFGKLLHSQTSGEGIVLKFSGRGKLWVCSRNRGGLLDWITSNLPQDKMVKNE